MPHIEISDKNRTRSAHGFDAGSLETAADATYHEASRDLAFFLYEHRDELTDRQREQLTRIGDTYRLSAFLRGV